MGTEHRLLDIADRLARELDDLDFSPPVAYVYNPMVYAREAFGAYVERFGRLTGRAVLLGMNPGPWGMAQTGVPFGEVSMVRDWMGIQSTVERPPREHPKRPVEGFACGRSEVSGRRLWGWARDRFGTAERFFEHFFVVNYCPLQFLEASGRNLPPDRLRRIERQPLMERCDRALRESIQALRPSRVIGIGGFAEGRARAVLAEADVEIARILHPSPASPAANRGWAAQAEAQLRQLGIHLPGD